MMSEKEKATREYLQTLTKDRVIELCLQYINDKNIAEQQLEALMLEISKQEVEQHDLPDYCTRTGTDCTYLGKIEELQRQLAESFTEEDVEGLIEDRNKTIKFLQKELAEKDKEIEDLKEWQKWYSMWHEKFQKQIEDLTTELETYRPTKLHGNGQCKCFNCNAINWTDWCSSYKGHTYCDNCLKVVLEDERQQQLKPFIKLLNEIKEYATTPIKDDGYSVNLKTPYEIAEYVDNHINALLGKSE